MTPCLSSDEFVDLLDGALADRRRAHLETCAACRVTAAQVRSALSLTAGVDVPEPSALFWPSVNARVRAAIDDAPVTGWQAWLRWDVIVPMAGLAALVVALASAVEHGMPAPSGGDPVAGSSASLTASSPPWAAEPDAAFAMMLDLVASLPEGGFDALGVTTLPEMGEASATLSADERRALAALLATAVERPAS